MTYYNNTFPHGLIFHHFHGSEFLSSQGSISSDQFADIIEYVGRDRILPAGEWLDRALSGKLQPREVCITFDDSLLCQVNLALPVLESFGLTAFWFVYSSVFEGATERLEVYRDFRHRNFESIELFYKAFERELELSPEAQNAGAQLKDFKAELYLPGSPFYSNADRRFRFLRDVVLGSKPYCKIMDAMIYRANYDTAGAAKRMWMTGAHLQKLAVNDHVVGLHSYSHPTVIADLPVADQVDEYRRNMDHLISATGQVPITMAHPCNSYNTDTLDVLKKLGVKIGFRSDTIRAEGHTELEFPREDHANIFAKIH